MTDAIDRPLHDAIVTAAQQYGMMTDDSVLVSWVVTGYSRTLDQLEAGVSTLFSIMPDGSNTYETEGLLRACLRQHVERQDD